MNLKSLNNTPNEKKLYDRQQIIGTEFIFSTIIIEFSNVVENIHNYV